MKTMTTMMILAALMALIGCGGDSGESAESADAKLAVVATTGQVGDLAAVVDGHDVSRLVAEAPFYDCLPLLQMIEGRIRMPGDELSGHRVCPQHRARSRQAGADQGQNHLEINSFHEFKA